MVTVQALWKHANCTKVFQVSARLTLPLLPNKRATIQFGLVRGDAVHPDLAFTPQAINIPSHFLEAPAFPGGTPFTPNKRTPFLYSTLRDACWGQFVPCSDVSPGIAVMCITLVSNRLLGQAVFNTML